MGVDLMRQPGIDPYEVELPFGVPVARSAAEVHALLDLVSAEELSRHNRLRLLATRMRVRLGDETAFEAGLLLCAALLHDLLRAMIRHYTEKQRPGSLEEAVRWVDARWEDAISAACSLAFAAEYPVRPTPLPPVAAREMLLLWLAVTNPALVRQRVLFDDGDLRRRAPYLDLVRGLSDFFAREGIPALEGTGMSLFDALQAPMRAAPGDLSAQVQFILDNFREMLPEELLHRALRIQDVIREIWAPRGFGKPELSVMDFRSIEAEKESERFSRDRDWMSNVVLIAKSTYVWLDQLSKSYGRHIHRIDQIPDAELSRLARWGFTSLWLIGLWERSPASAEMKRRMGNPEAVSSAYSLFDYRIAAELGGEEAYRDLSRRCWERGIRLAADMVPNHVGIYSRWVVEHPEWFLSLPQPPFPVYAFTGPDLSHDERVGLWIEDGYWSRSDAAVVFKRLCRRTGEVRYVYHGNDGTHMPWNDTAQLDFLNPDAREAVIRAIVDVARRFPVIRFDAAMTLARRHVRRLWWPAPGEGGAIPSRAEHSIPVEEFDRRMPAEFWREVVDRIASEAPDTLLLAEAFWLMEGYFVRTLGMHRVYNSAFMNMLVAEENSKYRQTVKNVLEFSPAVLERFVNFQNNPDEKPAVVQFGKGDKYFGVAILMVTMPGLPMWGHGQVEGFAEKYGMEYRRAYRDEQPDVAFVSRHEREVFPLMRRRHLFSQAASFTFYDFRSAAGDWVDQNVFAYSNRAGGERALVLYNNAYAGTAGRIYGSTPINVAHGDEEPRFVTRTLAEALAIDSAEGTYYAFRDHVSGFQYLRSGRELASEGLLVQLQGYQAQVFVDFREIRNADENWVGLYDELGGAAVESLDQLREDLVARPAMLELADAFTAALSEGRPREPGPAEDGTDEPAPSPEAAGLVSLGLLVRQVALAGWDPRLSPRHVARVAGDVLGDQVLGDLLVLVCTHTGVAALVGAARAFLGVNEHDGVTWFGKERMELLLAGWRLAALATAPPGDEERVAVAADRAARLAEAAEASGYRLADFLELAAELAP